MPHAINMFSLAIDSDPVYVVAIFVLASLWALEHFFIQASVFDSPPITRHPLCFQLGRLAINAFAAIFILAIVAVPWVWIIIGLDFFLSLVVIAYQKYFHKPFALFSAIKNLREGIKASSFALRIIPPNVWLWMVVGLVVKASLVAAISQWSITNEWNARFWIAMLSLALIFGIVLLLQKTSFRFNSIRHASMARIIYAYGYGISWIADFFLAPKADELSREAESLQKSSPNRLSPEIISYEIAHHVVIMQLESLDWNILNFSFDGKPVTPFLNELAASSQIFKVQAFHDQGSADMDYAVLSGGMPSKHMLSYSLPGLTFSDSLPRFMGANGFRTISLHGAMGNFFNRRFCFDQMGWDDIHFREELYREGVETSYWGIRDKEVFRVSSQKLNQATQPEFHFLITLDAHGPFNLIKDEEKTIFPKSRDWQQNYFNSMAALDNNLRDYVNTLPPETLVVLYGDHTSGVHYQSFSPARVGSIEYVPCIIHKKEGRNADRPKQIDPTQLPGDLSMLDIMNAIRGKLPR